MTGDATDMRARLAALLPLRWFPDSAPVLAALLAGLADGWAWLYAMLGYVRRQTRIATATDSFLDLIAQDFFGATLARRPGEADANLRARIQAALFAPRATRPALVAALTSLTGRAPLLFEPARPADTGAYGMALGYGLAGGWGSLALPFQVFVTAYRPFGAGTALIAGWGNGAGGAGPSPGGYGSGAIEYALLAPPPLQVSDAEINATIAAALPVAVTAWTRLSN
jgi:hypothetical protein